jgi:hypothetical protein
MDARHFDALTRTFTAGGTRRAVLRLLAALPLLGHLAGSEEAAAKQRPRRPSSKRVAVAAASCAKKCRTKDSKRARRRCRTRCQPPVPACTTNQDCPPDEQCEAGVCRPIRNQCTSDADCDPCERCDAGSCVARCAPDQVCRNDQCDDVECTADEDCRACSRCVENRCRWQCAPSERCLSGTCCQPRSCPAGLDCGTVDDHCGGQARCGPETCAPPDHPCQQTACQANVCTTEDRPTSTPCDDGNACTTQDRCEAGACMGTPVVCDDPPACRVAMGATCSAGTCTYSPAAAGTACGSGPCDTCDGAGSCVRGTPCAGGVCCAPGTEVCHQGVCALTCPGSTRCPAGAAGCLQTAVAGQVTQICIGDPNGTCGCSRNPESCPQGSICSSGPVAGCPPGSSGCYTIYQPT